ncbi:MAG: phosphonate ABC transporter, permease protein PhnE [Anaerolineae bacterium]|jgi:phosphonate transport system permease protein|nr:phosphonate ABC transporter, permease protein PhnE [Anaerolineae bacterium]
MNNAIDTHTATDKNTAIDRKLQEVETLRATLLRPIPRFSTRGVLVMLTIVLVLAWSFSGVGPSATNRITSFFDPFIAVGNLITRMLPPEFEIARSHNAVITLFGVEVTEFQITRSTVNLFGNEVEIGWPPIITAVFETVQMAIVGTLGAVLMALPLSLLAARNTSPHPALYQVTRLFLNFMRSIPELVYALLFVAAVGLGPFTGVLALAFGSVGSLTRVFAEAIEQIDPAQVNAVRATGAGSLQTFVYSVIPQAFPLFISYAIIYFESNVRHATILGYVGAGGVGFLLFKYTGTSDYDNLLGAALVMVVAVTVIDRLSSRLRQRFI